MSRAAFNLELFDSDIDELVLVGCWLLEQFYGFSEYRYVLQATTLQLDFQEAEKPAEAGSITALRTSLIDSKRLSTVLLLLCRSMWNFQP